MFPTSSTPPTFEQYLGRLTADGVAVADHLDEFRAMYDGERLFERLCPAPDDMPPCPSWCAFEHGHRYENIMDQDIAAGTMTLGRYHEDTRLPGGVISQEETWRDGRPTLAPPGVLLDEVGVGCDATATQARQRAADLLNIADRLDEISR